MSKSSQDPGPGGLSARLRHVIAPVPAYVSLVWPLAGVQLITWGAIYYAVTLFIQPMEAELGWSRAEIARGPTVGLLTAAVLSMVMGRLVDTGHARAVMTLGALFAGGMFAWWAAVDDVIHYTVMWVGMGAAFAALFYETGFAVVVRTMGNRATGAITVMTLVGGLASTAFLPFTHILIEAFGWRDALWVLAIIMAGVGGGVHFWVLRPGALAVPDDEEAAAADTSVSAATSPVRSASSPSALSIIAQPAFWCLAMAFGAVGFSAAALLFHFVPLMAERGADTAVAVAAYTFLGPSQVVGRLLFAGVLRKLDLRTSGGTAIGLVALSFLIVAVAPPTFAMAALAMIVLGIGNGVVTISRAEAARALAGVGNFGAVNGAMNLPIICARAFAPSAAALMWAAWGGYDRVLWVLIALGVLAIGAFLVGIAARRA